MPYVNGKFYRSAGQGYAAEKSKGKDGAYKEERPAVSNEPGEKGDGHEDGAGAVAHVKHLGGGKFHIKFEHHDGSKSQDKAESFDEMHAKMGEHFGEGAEEMGDAEHNSEEYDGEEDGGAALKSILG